MSVIRQFVAALMALSMALPAAPVLKPVVLGAAVLPAAAYLLAPGSADARDRSRVRMHQGGRHNGRPRHHGRPAIHTRPAHRPRHWNSHRRVDIHHHYHDRRRGGRFAAGLAVGAVASLAVGAIVASLPPSCSGVRIGGVYYQRCGGTWYAPRYDGPDVVYVVVQDPR